MLAFGVVAPALWGLLWLGSFVASKLHWPLVTLRESLCFRGVLGRSGEFDIFALLIYGSLTSAAWGLSW